MTDTKAPEQTAAQRRATQVMGFRIHLIVYLGVNLLLVVLNLLLLKTTGPSGEPLPLGVYFWCLYPLLGWGLGLFLHYAAVYLLSGPQFQAWKERKTKELAAKSRE